jgi:hypothetical protein
MTTLTDLAKKPIVQRVKVSEYSFASQERVMPKAGYPTANTQATLDYSGNPIDARQDYDN